MKKLSSKVQTPTVHLPKVSIPKVHIPKVPSVKYRKLQSPYIKNGKLIIPTPGGKHGKH